MLRFLSRHRTLAASIRSLEAQRDHATAEAERATDLAARLDVDRRGLVAMLAGRDRDAMKDRTVIEALRKQIEMLNRRLDRVARGVNGRMVG